MSGDRLVFLDSAGAPRAIVRKSHVERRRFNAIEAEFAQAAGEGDLSPAWWVAACRHEPVVRAEREGFEIDDELVLVLVGNDRVWLAVAAAL